MRLLLDSRVLLWWLAGEQLDDRAQGAIASADSVVFVSAVSVWEIEVKRERGRIRTHADLAEEALGAGFLELPIGFEHARAAGRLPAHHRDPFDRMLVAQAQVEGLVIVSRDRALGMYDVAAAPRLTYSGASATTRAGAPLAPSRRNGKQATWNPLDGSSPRLTSRSICE